MNKGIQWIKKLLADDLETVGASPASGRLFGKSAPGKKD